MRKCIILLPLEYNDGKEVPIRVINKILRDIDEEFDGHTVAGTVEGTYRMANRDMKGDISSEIWIVVDPNKLNVLRRMVSRFARTLKQESIFFEVTNSEVEFIGPETECEGV